LTVCRFGEIEAAATAVGVCIGVTVGVLVGVLVGVFVAVFVGVLVGVAQTEIVTVAKSSIVLFRPGGSYRRRYVKESDPQYELLGL